MQQAKVILPESERRCNAYSFTVEDRLHTENPTVKCDVEEEAGRFCPGTQIAVNFGGTSERIDDVFSSVKGDIKRNPELMTEGRGCLCWDYQFPIRVYGACMCIKKRDGKGPANIGDSIPRELKSLANRAEGVLCYYLRGEEICTGPPEDITKRGGKGPATIGDSVPGELKSIANRADDCPARTFPLCYYLLGEKICRCELEKK